MSEVWVYKPSQTQILDILAHFYRASLKLDTAAGQSSSDMVNTLPRHLNDDTTTSVRP